MISYLFITRTPEPVTGDDHSHLLHLVGFGVPSVALKIQHFINAGLREKEKNIEPGPFNPLNGLEDALAHPSKLYSCGPTYVPQTTAPLSVLMQTRPSVLSTTVTGQSVATEATFRAAMNAA